MVAQLLVVPWWLGNLRAGRSFVLKITRLEELIIDAETDDPKNECYKHSNKQRNLVTNINIKVPSNVPQEDHQCVFNKHKVVK